MASGDLEWGSTKCTQLTRLEEVLLVKEEMCRVLAYLEYKGSSWATTMVVLSRLRSKKTYMPTLGASHSY